MRVKSAVVNPLVILVLLLLPSPGYAEIEGHCVAFCDEPAAAEDSSGGGASAASEGAQLVLESRNETELKRLNREGIIAKQSGDYFKAIFLYREALGYASGFPGAEKYALAVNRNIAKAQNSVGAEAYARGDTINAVTYFEFAVASDPDSAVYRDNLKDAKSSLGYHEIYNPDPLFSKGNSQSAPVDARDLPSGEEALPVVNPKEIRKPAAFGQATLKSKDVPLPQALQVSKQDQAFQDSIFAGMNGTATMILDALEEGHGDIQMSIDFLESRVVSEDEASEEKDALSYLEGFKAGMISVDEDLKMLMADKKLAAQELGGYVPVQKVIFEEEMLAALDKMLAEHEKKLGIENWKTKRSKMLLEALDQGRGDIRESMAFLDRKMQDPASNDFQTASQARHYLTGLSVYPDFVKDGEK